MSTSTPKFNVAICGAGIAGLTLAIALSKFSDDITIDLYEAAAELTEVGAGVGMWRRPWRVMEALDLGEELSHLVLSAPLDVNPHLAFQMRKSDQPEGVSFYEMVVPIGLKPINLNFTDGTTATCDILVGADGIHSATRHTLLRDAAAEAEGTGDMEKAEKLRGVIEPVWSSWVAYRGVISSEDLKKVNPDHRALTTGQNYMGKHKHLIVFPMEHEGSELINIVAICSFPEKEYTSFEGKLVEERPHEELLELFEGWEPEVQEFLQFMRNPSRWVVNVLKGLPICVHGQVALIGDAAHAMTPHQGSGAGQAIEDAYVLAALLAHQQTTMRDPSAVRNALAAYETVRLPRGKEVTRLSRENGRLFEFIDVEHPDTLSVDDLKAMGNKVMSNWEWAWTTDPEDDRQRAIAIIEGGKFSEA